jgi:hypothetical protein
MTGQQAEKRTVVCVLYVGFLILSHIEFDQYPARNPRFLKDVWNQR